MDNLVACSVVLSLRASLVEAVLHDVVEEATRRFRLVFSNSNTERFQSIVVSVEPGRTWIGRPVLRRPKGKSTAGAFAALCRRHLVGRRLVALTKPDVERRVVLAFSGGFSLVAELPGQAANCILLGPGEEVLAATRREGPGQARLAQGATYSAPAPPPGRIDALVCGPAAIDELVAGGLEDGRPAAQALLRGLYGVGRDSIELALSESASLRRSVGTVLVQRRDELLRGRLEPVIEAGEDPGEAAAAGRQVEGGCGLLPWVPERPPAAGQSRFVHEDPAATVGLYYETLTLVAETRARGQMLLAILDQETARVRRALLRVEADRLRFEDPDRFRLWGEALLAGLTSATRDGERVLVANPYAEDGSRMAIPVPPGMPLPAAAAGCFAKHRRAKRGLAQTEARAAALASRREALLELRARHEQVDARGFRVEDLEREMRGLSIPVALERRTAKSRPKPVRLEGVRMLETSDGTPLLVGKGGRENDRLTFKIAAPEDFWLHAAGVPGAHVVLRNDEHQARPSAAALHEAAQIAAWFSDARAAGLVDVQWTRRKYVRRVRGAAPGMVTLKRHETVRVRASPPKGED